MQEVRSGERGACFSGTDAAATRAHAGHFYLQSAFLSSGFFRRQENVGDLGLLYGAQSNESGQPFRADSLFISKLRCAAAGCIMPSFDGI